MSISLTFRWHFSLKTPSPTQTHSYTHPQKLYRGLKDKKVSVCREKDLVPFVWGWAGSDLNLNLVAFICLSRRTKQKKSTCRFHQCRELAECNALQSSNKAPVEVKSTVLHHCASLRTTLGGSAAPLTTSYRLHKVTVALATAFGGHHPCGTQADSPSIRGQIVYTARHCSANEQSSFFRFSRRIEGPSSNTSSVLESARSWH